MKKEKILSISLLMVGVLLLFSLAAMSVNLPTKYLKYKNEQCDHAASQLQFEGNLDEYTKQYAIYSFNKVPEEYTDLLSEWEVIITNENIARLVASKDYAFNENTIAFSGNRYSGVTLLKDEEIYISGTPENIDSSMLHEIGHAIEKSLGYPSKKEEFIRIYEEEKDLIFIEDNQEYYKSTNREYWAECFEMFISEPTRLQENGPRTYEYMREVLGNKEN